MEFRDVIAGRRMVRAYRPDPVPEAAMDRIVAAGLSAPTAGNSRGVSLVVITDPSRRAEIADAADEPSYVERGFPPWLSGAPVHIAPCVEIDAYRERYSHPDKPGTGPEEWDVPYWWVDAGAVMMAILLGAVDEGLAAGFLGEHAIEDLAELCGAPDHVTPLGIITLGYPARGCPQPPHPPASDDRRSGSLDLPRPDRLHRERWQR